MLFERPLPCEPGGEALVVTLECAPGSICDAAGLRCLHKTIGIPVGAKSDAVSVAFVVARAVEVFESLIELILFNRELPMCCRSDLPPIAAAPRLEG